MTKDEIKQWAKDELLTLHKGSRGDPLRKKLDEIVEIAMREGEVPGWIVSNVLTALTKDHGYR